MSVTESAGIPAAEFLGHIIDGDMDALVRQVLDAIVRVTGLETSYLTFIDWAADTQEVRYSTTTGTLDLEEGLVVPWSDTLCRRAMTSGISATSDADASFGPDNAGHELGIVSYVSVPVITQDEVIYGTLCAASQTSHPMDEATTDLLRSFADLLGHQVDRERSFRRAERAEQRIRARMMMLAESEHRVKTPLTVILGVARMLSEHWDDLAEDQGREMIDTVLRQSLDLRDCVQVLLSQAREEMDDLEVPKTALYVEPVLTEVVTDHQRAASGHRIDHSCVGPVVARVDVVSLRQLLGHLIDNAVKYTPVGGHIVVSARAEDRLAIITVADDGPGLPEGIDPFAAFTRGSDSHQLAPGSGLGLYIVRNIAARAGGAVAARNGAAGGAEFVIELPAA